MNTNFIVRGLTVSKPERWVRGFYQGANMFNPEKSFIGFRKTLTDVVHTASLGFYLDVVDKNREFIYSGQIIKVTEKRGDEVHEWTATLKYVNYGFFLVRADGTKIPFGDVNGEMEVIGNEFKSN